MKLIAISGRRYVDGNRLQIQTEKEGIGTTNKI